MNQKSATRAAEPEFDAVVIGAGITGMYQVYVLREMGLKVRGFEAGGDVGGTWYWNRYPGCRLDTESYTYGYFALKGIIPEWTWSEQFAGQPELLRYARHAADRMDIRKDIQFDTRVTSACFDDESGLWVVSLQTGETVTCRFLLSALGPLSATRMPAIEGIESFRGQSFHSSRWPVDPDDPHGGRSYDFTGRRVGVIGTGATGVQIIPIAARTAAQLHVFQRTPNWCTPLGNRPIPADRMDELRRDYPEILEFVKSTPTAFPYQRSRYKAKDHTPQERSAFFESLYSMPGYGIWLSGYKDLLINRESNSYLADFIASKIRQRVKDPIVAEKLIPKNHPFGTKRVPMETNYYEVYNQPNVHLVDVNESPILRVTPTGIETKDGHIDLDVIIYATGFDAVTGAFDRIDIRGRGGVSLKETWADGPLTYLGLQVRGFPNFFTLVGPHNGAAFCNIGVCGGLQVEWVSRMIAFLRENGRTISEPGEEAQEAWTARVYEDFARTLLVEADAWWVKVKTNPDGTQTRRALIYLGDAPKYRELCEEVASRGYEGFELS
jgi:cyclohexanone monooxygenase